MTTNTTLVSLDHSQLVLILMYLEDFRATHNALEFHAITAEAPNPYMHGATASAEVKRLESALVTVDSEWRIRGTGMRCVFKPERPVILTSNGNPSD